MLVVEHTSGPSTASYAISGVYQGTNNVGHRDSGIQAVGYEGFEEGDEEQPGENAGMVRAVSIVSLKQKLMLILWAVGDGVHPISSLTSTISAVLIIFGAIFSTFIGVVPYFC